MNIMEEEPEDIAAMIEDSFDYPDWWDDVMDPELVSPLELVRISDSVLRIKRIVFVVDFDPIDSYIH